MDEACVDPIEWDVAVAKGFVQICQAVFEVGEAAGPVRCSHCASAVPFSPRYSRARALSGAAPVALDVVAFDKQLVLARHVPGLAGGARSHDSAAHRRAK